MRHIEMHFRSIHYINLGLYTIVEFDRCQIFWTQLDMITL